jgi:hypothetical protein
MHSEQKADRSSGQSNSAAGRARDCRLKVYWQSRAAGRTPVAQSTNGLRETLDIREIQRGQ